MAAIKTATRKTPVSRGPKMSGLLKAIEDLWTAIERNHPELRKALTVFVIQSNPRMTTLGHFAPGRWRTQTLNGRKGAKPVAEKDVHEVALVSAYLKRMAGSNGVGEDEDTAHGLAETVIHEAAHALGHVRGIVTTSGQGRYHNAQYALVAAEVGLEVSRTTYGWSSTALTPEVKKTYRKEIAVIRRALQMYRLADPRGKKKGNDRNRVPLVCGCGRNIGASRMEVEVGGIFCAHCEQEFRPKN
jgi:hypothetical protein